MNAILRFYRNHLKRKMFNRIILLYSAIIVILFLIAAVMVYQYQVQRVIREETEANLKTAHMLSIYLNRQYENIQNMVEHIYGDAALSDDLVYFLNNRYEAYLSHRLNLFSRPGEPRTSSFASLLKSYLEQNPEAKGATVFSYSENFYMQIREENQQLQYENGSKTDWEAWYARRRSFSWDTFQAYGAFPGQPGENYPRSYSYTRELQDPWTLKKVGMLMIDFDTEALTSWLNSRATDGRGRFLVITGEGIVIYDSQATGGYFGRKYPHLSRLDPTAKWVELDEKSRVNVLSAGNADLSVVGVVSESVIQGNLKKLRNALTVAALLFMTVGFSVTFTMMRRYSKKVGRIIRSMSRIGEGDLSTRIHMPGEDELQQISVRVNDMCERLESYIDKVYSSEIRQKHAELVALQSQINPHFLYNTLESIRMKAYTQGAGEVGRMIYSLSVMFKSMVKKDTVVSLEEEIELCSLYLDLLRIRYEGRLKVNIAAEPDIADCRMMKLLVQPLIENYIVHGFRSLDDDNEISIDAGEDGGRIVITVRDNGKGIAEERLAGIHQSLSSSPSSRLAGGAGSIGLVNVHERIRMNYGEEYGLTLHSKEGQGTLVRMELPMIREGVVR